VNGRMVKEVTNIVLPCNVDISDIPGGVYLLRISDGNKTLWSSKFIKK
jgi:hypothetical protein